MTQASNFLSTQLVDGTSNQIDDTNLYLENVTEAKGYSGETEKFGNEVMLFCDGSLIVRIDDEGFDYSDIEDYA